MTCCGSLAVVLGSAAGPYSVSLAIEAWGWHLGYAFLVGVPLTLAGLLYLTLDSLPSGLEVEEIERRMGQEATT
jgi:MFS family permease